VVSEDLSSKLNRLKAGLKKQSKKDALAGLMRGSDLLKEKDLPRELPEMERFIPGALRSCKSGCCFVADEFFTPEDSIGHYPLERLLRLNARDLIQTFDLGDFGDCDSDRILFIDTETTGLAGGTGTYAFQVGVGCLEEGGFRVLQFFMRDYDEEPAQMELLADLLSNCALLVTYNGATFDLPLLRTRFVFNRIRLALEEIPHLDLLPVARRLWKPAHGAANLSFLEEKILGNCREGDVPGMLIPTLYFQFLRGASPRTLAPVFYHNRMDIVALAALTERAWWCHRFPETIEDDWERFGVSRHFEKRGLFDQGLAVLDPLLAKCAEESPVWHHACRLAGLFCKRLGDTDRALENWWKVYHTGCFDPFVSIELAKILEHKLKDFAQAHRLVEDLFNGYGIEPEECFAEGEEGGGLFEADFEYDYSEGVRAYGDDLPVRDISNPGIDLPLAGPSIPVPKLTERLRQDLNRRLYRLKRKMGNL
jgi:uncharacterized protein YprB with RNaseH-like and TPR domain